ncbi:LamG-like jellyroll fold domain-containing protein, partial [Catellatospora methionotrophica]
LPTVSQVKVDLDPTCRSGTGQRLYLKTPTPEFSAHIGDLDAQNVRLQVEITPAGGATWPLIESTNGARDSISKVRLSAAQALQQNTIYAYRVRAADLTSAGAVVDYSAWSPSCEIQYDTTALDGVPLIDGIPTLDVDGEVYHLLKFGRSNVLTLRPDAADGGEVVRYSYGFSADRIGDSSASIPAGLDGTATVSVMPWEVDGHNAPVGDTTLYVRAYAGNGNSRTASVQVYFDPESPAPDPVPHVRDDVDGDGVPDQAGFRDLGNGEGMFYTYPGKPDGSLREPVALMISNSYTDANSDTVQGDFDGDGKTDFAVFKSISTNRTDVSLLWSRGNVPYADMLADTQVKTMALNLANMKVLAGDVDADGRDDLVFGYANSTTSWNIKVMLASVDSHDDPSDPTDDDDPHDDEVLFADPVDWMAANATSNLANGQLVIGQFDTEPGVDVMEFIELGSCRTGAFMHWNENASFTAGQQVWDSNGTGSWCAAKFKFTVGRYATGNDDFDGVVAVYDIGACQMGVYTFTPQQSSPTGTWTLESRVEQFATGATGQFWCGPWMELAMRDLSADGREDLIISYKCCGLQQQRMWQFTSTGTGLATPVLKWQGSLGKAGVGSVTSNGVSHYQLVAKHSGMCLAVNGSPIDGTALVQQPCARNLLDQRFVLEQRGAGHVRLHPQHIPSKCLIYDVIAAGGPVIQKTCSTGMSQETFQVEYVGGFTNDPADPKPTDITVRMVSNTTASRCIAVQAASMAAAAPAVQDTCQAPGYLGQSYYLRELADLQSVSRAAWAMNDSGGTLLADATGNGANAKITGGGVVGGGVLTLNGTSQFASVTGPPLYTSASPYTVSAWVKLDVGARAQTVVAQEGSTNSGFSLKLNANGKWNFTVLSNPNSTTFTAYTAASTQSAQVGVWTHLVGVYDAAAGETRLYVNGVLAGTATGSTSGYAGALIMGAARVSGARAEYLDGQIDDVRVWNHELAATEITDLAAARS